MGRGEGSSDLLATSSGCLLSTDLTLGHPSEQCLLSDSVGDDDVVKSETLFVSLRSSPCHRTDSPC